MKIRRLPEIDLARIATLPADKKRLALQGHKAGRAPYSYQPARNAAPDAMDAKPALMPHAPETPWEAIEARIRKETRGGDGEEPNLAVTRALYDFIREQRLEAIQMEFPRCPIGDGQSVAYWNNVVLKKGTDLFIPFVDHRRAAGLSSIDSKLFAASVMHEHLRAQNPDLASAKLAVIRFSSSAKTSTRSVKLWEAPETGLYSFEALDRMVAETYQIWGEVLAERIEEARRTGTGGGGFWG